MITVGRLLDSERSEVARLRVKDEQLPYVGTIEAIIDGAPSSSHFHTVKADGGIVGFFNIDAAYGDTYEFSSPGELGLRAFFIDGRYQGRGYGSRAVRRLKDYLREQYPEATSVALTVNCRNRTAYRAYLRGGFRDTRELYHGGRAGPQHILRLMLNEPPNRPRAT